jgi:hypothetical protein
MCEKYFTLSRAEGQKDGKKENRKVIYLRKISNIITKVYFGLFASDLKSL